MTAASPVLQLEVTGLPGKDYVLQTSTNFVNWRSIATNFSPPDPDVTLPGNLFDFIDTPATNLPVRFYRAQQQP